MRRRTALGLGAAACVGLLQTRASAQQKKKVAIVGGKLHRAGEKPLERSIIVIEDGKIASIGTDPAAAKGADIVSARGKVVTAGLVDPLTSIGLTEVSLEKSTRDDSARGSRPIRAAFKAADSYNPASSLVNITRIEGITSVGVMPHGGLVMGQSAWADLAGATPSVALANKSLALHVRLHGASSGAFEASRSTAFLLLRKLFSDAALYKANKRAFDRRQLRKLAVSRLDLEVTVRALEGKLPVVFHVDRSSDILNVLALAKKNKLKAVLASAAEGWKVAQKIAAANVPLIVYPLDHGPRSFAALGAREDNAKRLHAAGCKVALSTGESHNARKLRQEAGNAVRAGLPHAAAITAVTDTAAQILGMGDKYGSPKTGRLANLVVWSGDPFELSTKVEHMFVRGKRVKLHSRQTALFERYR